METGNGDSERGDTIQTTQGTEQAVGMVEYTTSPVDMMSLRELKMENYFGYTIAVITVLFTAFLITGYVKTMNVPYCPCAKTCRNALQLQAEQPELEMPYGCADNLIQCEGEQLSKADENECERKTTVERNCSTN